MKRKIYRIIIILLIILLSIYLYLSDFYKANNKIKKYLKSTKEVKVTKIDKGYFFDGYGKENAIIFYPGAKVDYKAYSKIMNELAKNGIDCFLIKMPFNIAFFDINAADDIIKNYKYKKWYLSGHSLGGFVSSIYINNKNKNNKNKKIAGIIFLASYATNPINKNVKILSIYGDKDGILNLEKYKTNQKNWNSNTSEFIIKGGNHSNFGDYGKQKGDRKSLITKENQQKQTINTIIDFIK